MRILVLGGTVFLSRQVAEEAVARGHAVTCACRGSSGTVPEGASQVCLDRSVDTDPGQGPWAELAATAWDAVVDVARTPSWVDTALAALSGSARHWVFVSTISVYADLSAPGGTVEDTPLLAPADGDLDDEGQDPTAYGRNKVACEQAVQDIRGQGAALLLRPGLIVGPGDPSGRFTYWPERMSRGGRVLAPRPEDAPVQVVDVRDLAAWVVDGCEQRRTGTFDATSPATTMAQALAEVGAGVGTAAELRWADPDALAERDVRPWAGPRALPLWLPPPELAGMLDRDVAASVATGLSCRPLAETARDTLAWTQQTPDAAVGGLRAEEELAVLDSLDRG